MQDICKSTFDVTLLH